MTSRNHVDYSRSPVEPPLHAEVPAELAGLRLDQALARLFPAYSRTRLQAWLKAARVTVDGNRPQARERVWGGEHVAVDPEPDAARPAAAQAITLPIVFEDAAILVIDKPAGLVVHPGSGNRDGTLMNGLLHHAPELAQLPRAGIVHRLDKDTSGLMVVAKSLPAQTSLVRQLQARSMRREYLALVCGTPRSEGRVQAAIGRDRMHRTRMAVVPAGKDAVTHFRRVEHGAGWSLLACTLETGRTHQIRVHMAAIGHPLVGDPVYLPRAAARALPQAARDFARQALHAARLSLAHPTSGVPCSWGSALPADLAALLDSLRRHGPAR
jgi:23S rRNA pseudouridine1911/1915/1917 synthase